MHGQRRHKIIKLEHEADLRRAVFRQLVARQAGNIAPVDDDAAARRAVKAAEQVQQRAFARAARPKNDDEFSLLEGQVHMVERAALMVAAGIDAADVLHFNNCHFLALVSFLLELRQPILRDRRQQRKRRRLCVLKSRKAVLQRFRHEAVIFSVPCGDLIAPVGKKQAR